MNQELNFDILILGGGIAGLWTLNHLRQQGYQAILLEKTALGFGQTIASQGIIHGGIKYALSGKISNSSVQISDMPQIWQACLRNEGNIDLSTVKILSDHYFLCSQQKITQHITQFFAQKALQSDNDALAPHEYPEFFQHPDFSGLLTRVHERVLDVPSLITALAKNMLPFIFKVDDCLLQKNNHKHQVIIKNELGQTFTLNANHIILTAGENNAELLKNISEENFMQVRALQMVALHADNLPSVFVHCVGLSINPVLTITSHVENNHKTVWYLGGQLAEDGVSRNKAEQISAAQTLIKQLFPWFTPLHPQWQTFNIHRAEGFNHGKRPESISLRTLDNLIIAWPTKLTFAPLLAEKITDLLPKPQASSSLATLPLPLPKPDIAPAIWESPC